MKAHEHIFAEWHLNNLHTWTNKQTYNTYMYIDGGKETVVAIENWADRNKVNCEKGKSLWRIQETLTTFLEVLVADMP